VGVNLLEMATPHFVGVEQRGRDSLRVHTQNATTAPESIIGTTVNDFLDTQLTKRSSTHDARFNSNIECGCEQRVSCHFWSKGFVSENGIDSLEFGMPCCLGAIPRGLRVRVQFLVVVFGRERKSEGKQIRQFP
jgi:hypothetical protein